MGLYQFTHRLVQEVLVQELSLTRRVRLHARIGGVLEGMYQPALEPHAAELAYHFSQSEAITGPEKVVEYSIMAGEQALQSYAYEEAEIHFRRAQASKEGQPMDAKATAILYSLARTIAATGGRLAAPVVLDNLQQAFQYYLDAGDLARAVQVAEYPVEQMAGTAVGRSEFINRALPLVPPDSQQEGRLLSTYALALYLALYKETGDYQGAQDAFNCAHAIAWREGDLTLEIRVLPGAGETTWWRLSLPEVAEFTRQVVDLSGQADEPRTEFQVRFYLARATTAAGDLSAARQGLPYLSAITEQLRDRSRIGDAISRNAAICFFTGDWEAALEICDRGLAHDSGSKAAMRSIRAMLDYERGASAEGWVHIEMPPPNWWALLENNKHCGSRCPPG